jgi:rhodanese-related sulfurtransferase
MKCSDVRLAHLLQFLLFSLMAFLAACQQPAPVVTQNPATSPQTSATPDASEWAKARKLVQDNFPDVAQISTQQLGDWLSDSTRAKPLLLDARNADEYAVSHLPEAINTKTEQQALSALQGQAKDRPIVVYCAIGYRSSALTRKLSAQGFTNVRNLDGSIFAWANEGRPVFRGSEQVRRVHPFNEKWGQLLNKELWQ